MWAIDFQFDETADRRRLKLANIVETIEALVPVRGAPKHLRMDNGQEMIAWGLREWCQLSGSRATYIEPGSPWENPFVESFNGRVRDELLQRRGVRRPPPGQGDCRKLADRVQDLPSYSSLGGLTPRPVRQDLDHQQHQPTLPQ